MKTAVIYARVSSKEQEVEGYSIPAQVALFKKYCKEKELNIVKEFQESESAKASGRKLFIQMLEYVKKNKIQAIVFEKVDRMTRNFSDLVTIYELMEQLDIEIHLVKNNLKIDRNSRSHEKFQLDIQVVIARNYINNLSEETVKGMKQKLLSGGWTHVAPFGYSNIKKNGKADICPNEDAAIVQEMFQLALRGYAVNRIRSEIMPTKKFAPSTVYNILTNKFYIGMMKSNGQYFEGNYEKIIDPVVFEMVQQKLSNRNNVIDAREREFRFSGLLTCECGYKMYGEVKKGKYITYGCGSRKVKRNCKSKTKYISETKVFEQLEDFIKRINLTAEDKQVIETAIHEVFQKIESESAEISDTKYTETKKLKDKILRLLDHYDDGLITKDEYIEQKEALHQKLIKAQAELEANVSVPIQVKENFLLLLEPIENLHLYWKKIENINYFQEILKNIFSNLIVKDGIIDIHLTNLGKILYKNGEHPEWLPKVVGT